MLGRKFDGRLDLSSRGRLDSVIRMSEFILGEAPAEDVGQARFPDAMGWPFFICMQDLASLWG